MEKQPARAYVDKGSRPADKNKPEKLNKAVVGRLDQQFPEFSPEQKMKKVLQKFSLPY